MGGNVSRLKQIPVKYANDNMFFVECTDGVHDSLKRNAAGVVPVEHLKYYNDLINLIEYSDFYSIRLEGCIDGDKAYIFRVIVRDELEEGP